MILGTHNPNNQIKFKTTMLKLCDYSDAYIHVNGSITVVGYEADAAAIEADRNNMEVTFENYGPFTDCIS